MYNAMDIQKVSQSVFRKAGKLGNLLEQYFFKQTNIFQLQKNRNTFDQVCFEKTFANTHLTKIYFIHNVREMRMMKFK